MKQTKQIKVKEVKVTKPRGRPRKNKELELGEDLNHWGDTRQYANEFYGDAARYTTQFDNDWN